MRRIKQIHQHQHKAQMHGPLDLRRICACGRRKKMKARKGYADETDENVQPALE
jgi:hypothetical protein